MKTITFFDTEIDYATKKILDLGAIKDNGSILHTTSLAKFKEFLHDTDYICGHNIFNHDLRYIGKALKAGHRTKIQPIDTLFLSALLFPQKPYHRLLKDDKLQTDELNNPVNDSLKARDLFYDEVEAFRLLNPRLQLIYHTLLGRCKAFVSFFDFIGFTNTSANQLRALIRQFFESHICSNLDLDKLIAKNPVELAYCLSLINCRDKISITPPWVLHNFPHVEDIMYLLRNKACLSGCVYCDKAFDANLGLQSIFGFKTYRRFGGESLQENAVKAALGNKSLLAVFPTGGGKSLTFQVPAIMAGKNTKGLTVVISPLQSLMKDQVDNLENSDITDAVTINGMLDPIERANSLSRVQDGSATLLYISPETLRSKTIERLLLGRNINRFVIDEAHCFSSWGQDFRVDYLYIAEFIRTLQKKKNINEAIPVSCFTATAKQKVIEDICAYFEENLGLELELFKTSIGRKNLHYKVYDCANEVEKYAKIRTLIEAKNCPTIIYVSRTKKAIELAARLDEDGVAALAFHGKMDIQEKRNNQDAFIAAEVMVMVATSAFGMGVDKKDVGVVIHHDISDSLENYVQEAGRAGRDERIEADCFVLFNEEDLNKHFLLLNQTKLSVKEIQQIWLAIKRITKQRLKVSNSALEIAREAGWDDNVYAIETRVTTAILALEQSGYLKRGQNMPRVYATGILAANAQQAIARIHASGLFSEGQERLAVRIIKKLISARSRQHANEETAESRIDYISDHLAIRKEDVIRSITLMREAGILADSKDLTAFIKKQDNLNVSKTILVIFTRLENYLLTVLAEKEQQFNIKELNEAAANAGCKKITPQKITTVLNFWSIKNWVKRRIHASSKNHLSIVCSQSIEYIRQRLEKRISLSKSIIEYLFYKAKTSQRAPESTQNLDFVEFSVLELKSYYEKENSFLKLAVTTDEFEDALHYLSRIGALSIEGGFLVLYNKLSISRLEKNNLIQYKNDDYKELELHYENKKQQIHIVGEYAEKMLEDYSQALKFVDDYFQLNYSIFLKKYFPGSRREDLTRNITPAKFRQLFGSLSLKQLDIIKDNQSKNIVVAAGPGSGKTKILVHKLASLLLLEDVKHEQLLMLTFSRAATTEFKKRLLYLVGNAANFVEIKTFHSYCFDLLGRVGNLEKADSILPETIRRIEVGEVEVGRITKSVLVIDEAQDMDPHEFKLIKTLMMRNEEMRVIAVGDDDQNIYTFRGADSRYFEQFVNEKQAEKYELVENYRSRKNLVEFTNQFVSRINNRFKQNPIHSVQQENGKISLFHYSSSSLEIAVVNDIISTDISGNIGILTQTNEEALLITGLLQKNEIPARLIQSTDNFNLFNMLELRAFFNDLGLNDSATVINEELWTEAKRVFILKFKGSSNFKLCKRLIQDFQSINPKIKYLSDFEIFIKESKLEDFIGKETILVSTIHKAKGKEFDNVVLMLSDLNQHSDEKNRLIYVALTRARNNLRIHLNSDFFSDIVVENLERNFNYEEYAQPSTLFLHLNHGDVNLGFFKQVQSDISQLQSGQMLTIRDEFLCNSSGKAVLKFSLHFLSRISQFEAKSYSLKEARVNFIVLWKSKNDENSEEVRIILPELVFSRNPERAC
jgi:ATP-dependent DNA helicase RecQ